MLKLKWVKVPSEGKVKKSGFYLLSSNMTACGIAPRIKYLLEWDDWDRTGSSFGRYDRYIGPIVFIPADDELELPDGWVVENDCAYDGDDWRITVKKKPNATADSVQIQVVKTTRQDCVKELNEIFKEIYKGN